MSEQMQRTLENLNCDIALFIHKGVCMACSMLWSKGKTSNIKMNINTKDICSKYTYIAVRLNEIAAPYNFKYIEIFFNFCLGNMLRYCLSKELMSCFH